MKPERERFSCPMASPVAGAGELASLLVVRPGSVSGLSRAMLAEVAR